MNNKRNTLLYRWVNMHLKLIRIIVPLVKHRNCSLKWSNNKLHPSLPSCHFVFFTSAHFSVWMPRRLPLCTRQYTDRQEWNPLCNSNGDKNVFRIIMKYLNNYAAVSHLYASSLSPASDFTTVCHVDFVTTGMSNGHFNSSLFSLYLWKGMWLKMCEWKIKYI